MAEAYMGEIRMFGGTFAPRNWALCNGSMLAISSYQGLYSLLGTYYGGDGRTNFALPDLRGRLPVHKGTGPGLTPRSIGARIGYEQVTITENTLPSHSHPMTASADNATNPSPVGNVLATCSTPFLVSPTDTNVIKNMSPLAVGNYGQGKGHENRMPFLCINFIICIVGTYPPRN